MIQNKTKLRKAIAEYIRTNEPIKTRALFRRFGYPAGQSLVTNLLSELEHDGGVRYVPGAGWVARDRLIY